MLLIESLIIAGLTTDYDLFYHDIKSTFQGLLLILVFCTVKWQET